MTWFAAVLFIFRVHRWARAHNKRLGRYGANSHYDLLASVLGDKDKAREAIFRLVDHTHRNGFVTNLDAVEAAEIENQPNGV
jgi:hypothetical protein